MEQQYKTAKELLTNSEQELITSISKMLNNRTVESSIKILSEVEYSIYQNSLVTLK